MKKLNTPVYVFDEDKLVSNIEKINSSFIKYYDNFRLAYSYKTNYLNAICKKTEELKCYAEVVSELEYQHALNIGVAPNNIIFNGVTRNIDLAKRKINNGCRFNVDNIDELEKLLNLFDGKAFKVGVRLNFDIGNDLVSRFGIDVNGDEYLRLLNIMSECHTLKIVGLHCHISKARDLESWKRRVEKMLSIANDFRDLEYIDFGSNMYSEMETSLAKQYADFIPTFEDYAKVVALPFSEKYIGNKRPELILELGTPVVANTIGVLSSVKNIKTVRGQTFITMDCSQFNLGAISLVKNVPVEIIKPYNCYHVENASFVGNTCIEHDILNTGFTGKIGVGSKVLFKNCGAYSLVNEPDFIHAKIPVYNISKQQYECKEKTYDEVFGRYE